MDTPIKITDYLNEDLILFLNAANRDDALYQLIKALKRGGKLLNERLFYNAILEREKLVSTGIGMGVAVPHAKLKNFDEFFIAIGIQKEDGLEWKSLDNAKVHLIFMIGGPDNRQTQYLKILSRLTVLIKDRNLRQSLLKMKNAQEVLAALARKDQSCLNLL
jgi:PTS system nitrogen regulatory IIA component